MKAIVCSPRGFCAGVERAIEVVERALAKFGAPVYVRHEIVHNRVVVEDLITRGAVFVDELGQVPAGAPVVFSAHGVEPKVYDEADKLALSQIDATCPLVTKVHMEARSYAKRGFTILLIGHREHVEVVGVVGEAPSRTSRLSTFTNRTGQFVRCKVTTPACVASGVRLPNISINAGLSPR